MALVASVRLPFDPRTRWFDPKDFEIHAGDGVIVRTARGLEFGQAVGEVAEVDDLQIKNLRSPLQPVVRMATDEDRDQRDAMERLSKEALPVFKRLAAQTNENMHPIKVQYLFDGNRAVFLFEAEERTDFRKLVRRLSSELHVHVDMRQIGVRDEARIVGGIGHCGQELCCSRMGGEICPVSIKMAKAQDLSLNPQQISGVCGRLMCCLRYEYDTYKDFKSRAPKNNATISTPEGDFKVCQLDMPHEEVVLRTDEGKRVRIPLSAFDEPAEDAESRRPRSIGDAYYEYAQASERDARSALLVGSTERFTGKDKLAEKGEIHRNPTRPHRTETESGEKKSTRRRRRRSRGGQPGAQDSSNRPGAARGGLSSRSKNGHAGQKGEGHAPAHRRSRNRNHNVSEESRAKHTELAKKSDGTLAKTDGQKQQQKPEKKQGGNKNNRKSRPPRKSGSGNRPKGAQGGRAAAQGAKQGGTGNGGNGSSHRRSRRRTHKTGGTEDAV